MTMEELEFWNKRLLPCPFCGGKAVMTNLRMSDHSFKVGCYNDDCWRPGTDFYATADMAVDGWNKRAATPAVRDGAVATIHGKNCTKVLHSGNGHLHDANDDRPYDVDGLNYCGRCHEYLSMDGAAKERG